MQQSFKQWLASGSPFIWLNAGAVALSTIMVVGLLALIAVEGLGHFWPGNLASFSYTESDGTAGRMLGEISDEEVVARSVLPEKDARLDEAGPVITRFLVKTGNRDLNGADFRWVLRPAMGVVDYPGDAIVIERREWGNFYGFLHGIKGKENGASAGEEAWEQFRRGIEEANATFLEIRHIEKDLIGAINYKIERLRLDERRLEIRGRKNPDAMAALAEQQKELQRGYDELTTRLPELYESLNHPVFLLRTADGQEVEMPAGKIVRAYRPNDMGFLRKSGFYAQKLWEFVSDEPREANTEGGIFPAIFGTVMMVMIMAVIVTPFGVIAALYLREYAKQGLLTRLIRIAVNNLAGVPSIVYGVFGLGFFVYFIGGSIDQLLFPEALPNPTFGTPGLIWASLTLALLTVPVVIVATEEGLARVPREIREGSLALGATKAETLWRTVLPMTASAIMTGMILAIARAAGEVAPLMLVGVVKLAPSLPLDTNFPFLHLERKFMHLGFHIYDVGFQSPNVEAARPLVYATSLLLVFIIVILNLTAIQIRNRLREKYRAAEQN